MNESIIISDKVREQITARAGLVGIGIKTRRASVAPQPAWTFQQPPLSGQEGGGLPLWLFGLLGAGLAV